MKQKFLYEPPVTEEFALDIENVILNASTEPFIDDPNPVVW